MPETLLKIKPGKRKGCLFININLKRGCLQKVASFYTRSCMQLYKQTVPDFRKKRRGNYVYGQITGK
ncbi:hypothetical protein D770_23905 [Flammeovirgaceae bacterium 311]|nr:hypothetical protein D770_23905 [Flammeovirgaceae bacterium 311]